MNLRPAGPILEAVKSVTSGGGKEGKREIKRNSFTFGGGKERKREIKVIKLHPGKTEREREE